MKIGIEAIVEIDKNGRIVIPKAIRAKIKATALQISYDEQHDDIHLMPVKPLDSLFGAFKGIKKDYKKGHGEEWREYPDR